MKYFSKIRTRIGAVALAGVMLFTAAGCGVSADNVKSVKYVKSEEKTASSFAGEGYHLMTDNLKLVAKSGLIEMYWDEATCSVAVKETSQNHIWYSLPKDSNGKEKNPAAVVSLEAVRGSERYVLNSQDNSVAYGTARYETSENGITVTYTIAADEKTAHKDVKSRTAEDIVFDVVIRYELKDGSLFVSTDCRKMSESAVKITKLGIMEYFGSGINSAETDFMLLPDGCGAELYPAAEKGNEKTKNLSFKVYGQDVSVPENTENVYDALLPVYGMKQGSSAFAALIQEGDAIATINASHTDGECGYYHVGSVFDLTSDYSVTDEKGNTSRYISESSYDGKLQICYRFLSGNHADASGMALACREQLIRDAVLSTKSVETENTNLPFFLSVIGESPKGKKQSSSGKKFTSFSQALDMVTQMKAKGVNNISLRYKGALSGGVDYDPVNSAELLRSLGGKKDFNELYDEMNTQSLNLYLDIPLVSSGIDNKFSSGKSAVSILGKRAFGKQKNPLVDYAGPENLSYNFMDLSFLEESTRDLMVYGKKINLSGYCLNDAGKYLYSSFGKEYIGRQEASERLALQSESLSTNRRLMVDNGFFYMLKNADEVVDLPLASAVSETNGYVSIPFVQMLLHGTLDYAGTPMNYSENSELAMLRSIEYGACPSFEWVYEEVSAKNKTDNTPTVYYGDSLSRAAEYYERADEVLGDLRASRITKHSKVAGAEGVYCTEYSTGSLVYVNYNDTEASVNGVTIPAKDFLRIN